MRFEPQNPIYYAYFNFVFPLDILVYSTADIECVETLFHVCVDPIDRSILLVLALYELDSVRERVSIPRDTDPWHHLGLHSNGPLQFDAMELTTWKEFRNLAN